MAVQTKREQIRQAALTLFKQRGFAGVSVDEIARAAAVSKPTLYNHWSSKEELFVDLLEAVCREAMDPVVAARPDGRCFEDTMKLLARSYARAVLQPEVVELHRLFISEAARFPELGKRYYETGPQAAHGALARFFVRQKEHLPRAAEDPEAAAEHFAALILSPLRLRLLFAVEKEVAPAQLERWTDAGVRVFLQAYGTCCGPAGSD